MGSPISQIASSTQPQGKGFASPQPQQPGQLSDLRSSINAAEQQGIQTDFSLMHGGPNVGSQMNAPQSQMSYGFKNPNQGMMMSPAVQPTQGKGGSVTLPGQGGQPKFGQPNMYPNTIGQWDNASIQPQQSRNRGGKGKG
jgi:hypothetical protein